eukprot:scaffold421367_cov62-Attheya_sp.AAC.5
MTIPDIETCHIIDRYTLKGYMPLNNKGSGLENPPSSARSRQSFGKMWTRKVAVRVRATRTKGASNEHVDFQIYLIDSAKNCRLVPNATRQRGNHKREREPKEGENWDKSAGESVFVTRTAGAAKLPNHVAAEWIVPRRLILVEAQIGSRQSAIEQLERE